MLASLIVVDFEKSSVDCALHMQHATPPKFKDPMGHNEWTLMTKLFLSMGVIFGTTDTFVFPALPRPHKLGEP